MTISYEGLLNGYELTGRGLINTNDLLDRSFKLSDFIMKVHSGNFFQKQDTNIERGTPNISIKDYNEQHVFNNTKIEYVFLKKREPYRKNIVKNGSMYIEQELYNRKNQDKKYSRKLLYNENDYIHILISTPNHPDEFMNYVLDKTPGEGKLGKVEHLFSDFNELKQQIMKKDKLILDKIKKN